MSKNIQLLEVSDDAVRISTPNHISGGLFNGFARSGSSIVGTHGILIVGASKDERREIAQAILRSIGEV
jgi:hypothetical protein